MLHYEKRSWFVETPQTPPPPKREKRTIFTPDEGDLAVWERNFNRQFGLA